MRIILQDRDLTETEQKQYEDLLPYLIKRVRNTVVYEYAFNDELRLAWAKHLFVTEYRPLLKSHSTAEVRAVIDQ